ncbi:ribonuclease P protein component, partial [Salmonella enterica]|uniref:ribonuclease P protein component n=1 Tax=Salmonella enterica TaxID=28901 RepID=UPI003FA6AD8B
MQRLKTRAQFQAVLAGRPVSRTPHFALHQLGLPGAGGAAAPAVSPPPLFAQPASVPAQPWLGAMVPKRWARRAVTRNAIKRQIHAVSAVYQARLPLAAHVVRLRAGFERSQFVSASSELLKRAVREELQQLFERALAANTPSQTV